MTSPILLLSVLFLCLVWRSARIFAARKRPERVIVLGTGVGARKLTAIVEAATPRGSVVGFITEGSGLDIAAPGPTLPGPILGSVLELRAVVDSVRPDRIIVAPGDPRRHLPVQALFECGASGVAIETSIQAYERLKGKLAVESMTPSYLLASGLFCGSMRVNPRQEAIARALSAVIAFVGLIIAAPFLLIVAALIKLDSPGPVVFIHERIGLYGKAFKLLKFRTMKVGKQTSEWETDNLDRITRVGKWIRKLWLDEVLQFVNILRGDMNLVGPRPHPVSNYELFVKGIPYYDLRGTVRPGLTGWAQVRNGYANNLEQEIEKMRYDLYYIKHRSLWLDLRIVLETLTVVLFRLRVRPAPPDLRQPVSQPVATRPAESEGRRRDSGNPAVGSA